MNQGSTTTLNMPTVNLKCFPLNPEIVNLIPEEFAREHGVLALGFLGGDNKSRPATGIRVAMEDPNNVDLIKILADMTKLPITPTLSVGVKVGDMIDAAYHPK